MNEFHMLPQALEILDRFAADAAVNWSGNMRFQVLLQISHINETLLANVTDKWALVAVPHLFVDIQFCGQSEFFIALIATVWLSAVVTLSEMLLQQFFLFEFLLTQTACDHDFFISFARFDVRPFMLEKLVPRCESGIAQFALETHFAGVVALMFCQIVFTAIAFLAIWARKWLLNLWMPPHVGRQWFFAGEIPFATATGTIHFHFHFVIQRY